MIKSDFKKNHLILFRKPIFTLLIYLAFLPLLMAYPNPDDSIAYSHAFSGLRIRKSPSEKGEVLATIPYGSKVKVISSEGEETILLGLKGRWSKVEWNKKNGYVFNGLLSRYPLIQDQQSWEDYFKKERIAFQGESKILDEIGTVNADYILDQISVEETFFLIRSTSYYRDSLAPLNLAKDKQEYTTPLTNFRIKCTITRKATGQMEHIVLEMATGGNENFEISRDAQGKTLLHIVMVPP
jgi:hypothetical protein